MLGSGDLGQHGGLQGRHRLEGIETGDTAGQCLGRLDLAQHVEQTACHVLVANDRQAALLTLVGIGQGMVIGRARHATESCAHQQVGIGMDGVDRALEILRPGQQVVDADLDVVEIQLALRQCALADLFQRLATGNPGQVGRYHHAEAVLRIRAIRGLGSAIEHAEVGDAAIGDPGGLLTIDDDMAVADPRRAIGAAVTTLGMEQLLADVQRVRAVVRLGNSPAADQLLGVLLEHELVTHLRRHVEGQHARCGRNSQPRISPTKLFEEDREHHCTLFIAEAEQQFQADTQLVVLTEELVEARAFGCHLLGTQPIQFLADRPHHLGGELAQTLAKSLGLIVQRWFTGPGTELHLGLGRPLLRRQIGRVHIADSC
ncbi:hypothetical protein D9M69_388030 [compost metagenome]